MKKSNIKNSDEAQRSYHNQVPAPVDYILLVGHSRQGLAGLFGHHLCAQLDLLLSLGDLHQYSVHAVAAEHEAKV